MINDWQLVTRHIMGNVPGWLATTFYASAAAACGWTLWQLAGRIRQYRQGRPAPLPSASTPPPSSASGSLPGASGAGAAGVLHVLAGAVRRLPFHRQLLRDRYAGVAHLLTFYGFLILFAGTCLVFLEHDTPLHFFYGRFYLVASLIIDLGGVAFITGLSMFLLRRHGRKAKRLLRRRDVAALAWLSLAIGVSGFLLEGARIAVDFPPFERWSAVGYSVACGLNAAGVSGDAALELHRAAWGLHAALCVGFFAAVSWGFFSHMVFGPISWALRSQGPRAALRNVGADAASAAPASGALSWRHMSWLDLLQADACTTCGRCNSVCPAHAAGKALQPRDVVLRLRDAMHEATTHEISADSAERQDDYAGRVADDAIWSCTTCGACNDACPVGIGVYDKIVELRRGRVEAGCIPPSAAQRFVQTEQEFNPFSGAAADRLQWAAGLSVPVAQADEPIELLYWVGCAGSFDPQGRNVSRAMVKLLNSLGVSYRVLGTRERCTGDPARRMGEEGLFQELAQGNAELFRRHGVQRILTHCAHCYNTFRNEYPQQTGARIEVEHHSEFLAHAIARGKLKLPSDVGRKVTFHDPCYLGRGNGQYEAPRQILDALPRLECVEMPRHGRNSFCCGAGGGSLWLDVQGTDRVENQRAAEAAATGAEIVVTGCPFCKGMLEAGGQALPSAKFQVKDLAELVVQAAGM